MKTEGLSDWSWLWLYIVFMCSRTLLLGGRSGHWNLANRAAQDKLKYQNVINGKMALGLANDIPSDGCPQTSWAASYEEADSFAGCQTTDHLQTNQMQAFIHSLAYMQTNKILHSLQFVNYHA